MAEDTPLNNEEVVLGRGIMEQSSPALTSSSEPPFLSLGNKGVAPHHEQNHTRNLPSLHLSHQIRLWFVFLVFALVWTSFFVGIASDQKEQKLLQLQIVTDALMHTQHIEETAASAVQGNPKAFKGLEESQTALSKELKLLMYGGNYQGYQLERAQASDLAMLQDSQHSWAAIDKAAGTLLKLKEELIDLEQALKKLTAIPPRLTNLLEEITMVSITTPKASLVSNQLLTLMLRLEGDVKSVINAQSDTSLLRNDIATFSKVLNNVLTGPVTQSSFEAHQKLLALQSEFTHYQMLLETWLDKLSTETTANQALKLMQSENEDLRLLLNTARSNYRHQVTQMGWSNYLTLFGFAMAFIAVITMTFLLLKEGRYLAKKAEDWREELAFQMKQAQQREKAAKQMNDDNQAAILKLMNELQEVADGDLTVQATVSKGIAGAIADSVNYILEELRSLLARVITAAEQIVVAVNQAEEVSDVLLNAARQQSQEIQNTCQIIDNPVIMVEQGRQTNQFVDAKQSLADNIKRILDNALQTQNGVEQTVQSIHELSRVAQELQNAIGHFRVIG